MKISKKFLKGFTLIELLVVISIIGILATLITLNYKNSRIKARDAKRKQDLSTYSTAIESYFDDYNFYPNVKCSMIAAAVLSSWKGELIPEDLAALIKNKNPGEIKYLQSILDDPLVKDTDAIEYNEAWGNRERWIKTVKRENHWSDSLAITCRYAYVGGGKESLKFPSETTTIFGYNLSSCIENSTNRLPEQDGGKNPFRYEVGPGRKDVTVCGALHTFTSISTGGVDGIEGYIIHGKNSDCKQYD